MDYLNQKEFAKTINSAKNKPVPQLKWYEEKRVETPTSSCSGKRNKTFKFLPYDYLVNFENNKIVIVEFLWKLLFL